MSSAYGGGGFAGAMHVPSVQKRVYFTRHFAYDSRKMMAGKYTITICAMTEADLDAVLAIEAGSFPHPWTKEHFLQELGSSHSFPLVAIAAGSVIAGYICPMLVIDEGHILDVAVSPAYRGLGIGRLLVERVLHDCRDAGADFVSLEVRPSNVGALALYGALGFVETGRRKRYYQDGEDAVLMEYIFSTSEE